MRADICESQDTATFAHFCEVLKEFGASAQSHNWAIGVDHWEVNIQGQSLHVYSDSWYVDIEGSAELVDRIVNRMQQSRPQP